MAKLDKYIQEVKKDQEFKQEQKKLHDKHSTVPKNTVIVEKNVGVKATVNMAENVVKAIFAIILIVLATVGILTLLYPETRSVFFELLEKLFNQILDLLGME